MDDGLKQRLIGAFVLLALAVIFIPVFFDRERIEPVSKRTQIPPAPYIEPLVVEKAAKPITEVPAKTKNEMFIPDENEKEDVQQELENVKAEAPKAQAPKAQPQATQTKTAQAKTAEKRNQSAQKVDANGVPRSWVLQVASFLYEKHALERRDELVAEGYAAYVKNVETPKGSRTRLYVGPKLDKSILIAQKKKIDKKLGVDAILLKFDP